MEGKLHKCTLTQGRSKITLRVVNKPRVSGTGSTFEEAYEALIGCIMLKLGDGEPRVTFRGIYPAHKRDAPWARCDWVVGYSMGECMLEWNVDRLFTGGVCGLCGTPRGRRNQEPLVAMAGSSGDYCSAWFGWDEDRPMTHLMKNGYSPLIVSESFFEQLKGAERDAFDWREVRMHTRSRRRYIECVPRRFVKCVVHKEWEYEWLRCDECGWGTQHCSPMGELWDFGIVRIRSWLRASTLKGRDELPFAVGCPGSYQIVWPTSAGLRLSKALSGMNLFHAGVIAPRDVNPSPRPTSLAKQWKGSRADHPDRDA